MKRRQRIIQYAVALGVGYNLGVLAHGGSYPTLSAFAAGFGLMAVIAVEALS